MGAVFLARHKELGSLVAIKILPLDVRFSPGRQGRRRSRGSSGGGELRCLPVEKQRVVADNSPPKL